MRPYLWVIALTPLQGAFTTLFAATNSRVWDNRGHFKGQYIVEFGKVEELTTVPARDEQLAHTLWKTTEAVIETMNDTAS